MYDTYRQHLIHFDENYDLNPKNTQFMKKFDQKYLVSLCLMQMCCLTIVGNPLVSYMARNLVDPSFVLVLLFLVKIFIMEFAQFKPRNKTVTELLILRKSDTLSGCQFLLSRQKTRQRTLGVVQIKYCKFCAHDQLR